VSNADDRLPAEEPPKPDARAEMLARLDFMCSKSIAELVTVAIFVASEHFPEEVRRTLNQLYDFKDLENRLNALWQKGVQIQQTAERAEQHLFELRRAVEAIHKDIQKLGYKKKELVERQEREERKRYGG
jgi:dsDNA-specific endonuclease/ATPase MutS2